MRRRKFGCVEDVEKATEEEVFMISVQNAIFQKKGHFANIFRKLYKRSNQVQLLDNGDTDSETESFIDTVTTAARKENVWNAKVELDGKWIRFKVDSSGDITTEPSSRIPKETKLTKTVKNCLVQDMQKSNSKASFQQI